MPDTTTHPNPGGLPHSTTHKNQDPDFALFQPIAKHLFNRSVAESQVAAQLAEDLDERFVTFSFLTNILSLG
jgi:hypothetical protein